MATTIRMRRGGRTHSPYYRVVVIDSRSRNRGRVLDEIGIYHPCARPEPRMEIDMAKALTWLYKGATYSDTARSVMSKMGVMAAFAAGTKPEDVKVEAPAAVESTEAAAPAAEASVETASAAPEIFEAQETPEE